MKIKDFIKNISTLQEGQRIRITFFKDKIPILWGKQEIDTIFKKWEYEDEEMKNIYIYIYIPECIFYLRNIESIEILED